MGVTKEATFRPSGGRLFLRGVSSRFRALLPVLTPGGRQGALTH